MSNSPCLKDALIGNYQYVTNVVIQFKINYRPVSNPPQAYIEKLTGFHNSLEASRYHD